MKSSFLKRTLSKEDAIIQILRPQLAGLVSQSLDVFDRLVSNAETYVNLGTAIRVGNGEQLHITPKDLKANLDEFQELEKLAKDGREFLRSIGYVGQRKSAPIPGTAKVGETVDVKPLSMQLPGQEPVAGAMVAPKGKGGKK